MLAGPERVLRHRDPVRRRPNPSLPKLGLQLETHSALRHSLKIDDVNSSSASPSPSAPPLLSPSSLYQTSPNGLASTSNDHADSFCCVSQNAVSATSSG